MQNADCFSGNVVLKLFSIDDVEKNNTKEKLSNFSYWNTVALKSCQQSKPVWVYESTMFWVGIPTSCRTQKDVTF